MFHYPNEPLIFVPIPLAQLSPIKEAKIPCIVEGLARYTSVTTLPADKEEDFDPNSESNHR